MPETPQAKAITAVFVAGREFGHVMNTQFFHVEGTTHFFHV